MPSDMSSDLAHEPVADRKLTEFLTYRVVRLHHALNAQGMDVLNDVAGVTLSQWRVIAMVGSGTATTSRDIARVSVIDPAIISRTVHGLEEAGLLTTSRPADDRRVLQMALTGRGREIYARTLPHMQARQNALLGALSAAEQEMIFGIFDKLEEAAESRDFLK